MSAVGQGTGRCLPGGKRSRVVAGIDAAGRTGNRGGRSRFLSYVLALLATVLQVISPVGAAQTPVDGTAADARFAGEHRVALVIGNGRYAASPLINPVNDARAMGQTLRALGFHVSLLEDATMKQMTDAARAFGDTLQRGGVGLFFYAGHGMQIKGRNYLIPIGADIQREDEVSFNAFDAALLLEKMEAAKSRVNIVILDACRNNPFARSFRSAAQGLAQMDAPVGTYLSFATAPAKVASDGKDGNGLYTQHLLEAIRTPGLKIEEVFKRVRVKVMADSNGEQVPWDNSSLAGDFYFMHPAAADTPPLPAVASPAPAVTLATVAAAGEPTRAGAAAASPATIKLAVAAQPPAAKPSVAARTASESTVLLAKAAPAGSGRPAPPAAPKPDRVAAEAAAALYRKGMDAQSGGNLVSAADALSRAAEAGHAGAAYQLGLLLKIGRKPITQDLARAQRLFVQAAELGNSTAQYEVAQMFARGLGGPRNCTEAARWSQKAAEAGSPDAALLLGELHKAECAGTRNSQEAARWFRVAADKGLPNAQFSLGVLYVNGDGVPKDIKEARKWLEAAASKGNTSAKFYLDRLGK